MKRIMWAALLIAGPALGQVYKCNQGGSVVFTSAPCDADSKPIDVRPATGAGGPVDAMQAINNRRIATGRVGVGMTARQVRASWGAPHKINVSHYASGVAEQWIYYRDEQHISAQYVHFQNGIVSSVSD